MRERTRAPRGGLVSWPLYRALALLSLVPVVLAVLTVREPDTPPAPVRPLEFDGSAAATLAAALPQPAPADEAGADLESGDWVADRFADVGLRPRRTAFAAEVPWQSDPVPMLNVAGLDRGRSREVVAVIAHRDVAPDGEGSAAATGILLQLARQLTPGRLDRGVLYVSTDGGATGGQGAEWLATADRFADRIVAAVVLDDLSPEPGTALEIETRPEGLHGPSPTLVAAARDAASLGTGIDPHMPGPLGQLGAYAIPYAPDEQGPLLANGVSALTLRAAEPTEGEGFAQLDPAGMERAGLAVANLVTGLAGPTPLEPGGDPAVFLEGKTTRGWLTEMALGGLLVAPLACAVQVVGRCRHGRIGLRTAASAVAWRAATCLVALAALWTISLLPGHLLSRADVAPLHDRTGATAAGIALAAGAALVFWRFVARPRLVPLGRTTSSERTGGFAAAIAALAGVALLLAAVNPFTLVVLVPGLHAWLWLPAAARAGRRALVAVYAAGFLGVAAVLVQLGAATGLGWEAPEAVVAMVASGYLSPAVSVCLALAAACAAQLGAVVADRYAPAHPPAPGV